MNGISFARIKDYIAIMVSSFYLIVQMTYLGWYFSQSSEILDLGNIFLAYLFSSASFCLSHQHRAELSVQNRVPASNKRDSQGTQGYKFRRAFKGDIEPIYLTSFDEIGDLAAITNQVVVQFSNIINKINDAVVQLSESSRRPARGFP